jgi:hypothetical protein
MNFGCVIEELGHEESNAYAAGNRPYEHPKGSDFHSGPRAPFSY